MEARSDSDLGMWSWNPKTLRRGLHGLRVVRIVTKVLGELPGAPVTRASSIAPGRSSTAPCNPTMAPWKPNIFYVFDFTKLAPEITQEATGMGNRSSKEDS